MSLNVTGTQGTTSTPYAAAGASYPTAAGGALMPSPSTINMSDAMLTLMDMLQSTQAKTITAQNTRVQAHEAQRQHEIDVEKDALKRKQEAEQSKGGFFHDLVKAVKDVASAVSHGRFADAVSDVNDDVVKDPQFWKDLEAGAGEVAKWAAVAGSVALAVASGGAGAPVMALAIMGAVLSSAAAVDSEAHVLERCGVDAKTAGWVDLGMSVGGAAAGAGAGVIAMSSAAASASASTAASGARAAGTAVDAGAAGAAVVKGAAHTQVGRFQADAADAVADVKQADLAQKRIDELLKILLEAMSDTYKSTQKTVGDVQSALTTYSHAVMSTTTVRA